MIRFLFQVDGLRWIPTSECGSERVEANVGLEEDGDGEVNWRWVDHVWRLMMMSRC